MYMERQRKRKIQSQSLFQQKDLCNENMVKEIHKEGQVTILILVEGSLQFSKKHLLDFKVKLSQSLFQQKVLCNMSGRNNPTPFFCHNPYFSRRFFAIQVRENMGLLYVSHNPYFSRRFFAILIKLIIQILYLLSQSLFQQKVLCNDILNEYTTAFNLVTILILVEGSLQFCLLMQTRYLRTSQSLFQQKVLCNTKKEIFKHNINLVTILILVEGSLQ